MNADKFKVKWRDAGDHLDGLQRYDLKELAQPSEVDWVVEMGVEVDVEVCVETEKEFLQNWAESHVDMGLTLTPNVMLEEGQLEACVIYRPARQAPRRGRLFCRTYNRQFKRKLALGDNLRPEQGNETFKKICTDELLQRQAALRSDKVIGSVPDLTTLLKVKKELVSGKRHRQACAQQGVESTTDEVIMSAAQAAAYDPRQVHLVGELPDEPAKKSSKGKGRTGVAAPRASSAPVKVQPGAKKASRSSAPSVKIKRPAVDDSDEELQSTSLASSLVAMQPPGARKQGEPKVEPAGDNEAEANEMHTEVPEEDEEEFDCYETEITKVIQGKAKLSHFAGTGLGFWGRGARKVERLCGQDREGDRGMIGLRCGLANQGV